MELPADELADAAQLLSALATAPAPRAAPPPAPSAQPLALLAPGHLRCLDPSHDGGCGAPPVAGTEASYELAGDPGRKNGEKLLKSLLSRTPEWRDRGSRAAAAAACDVVGETKLARVMRGQDTSAALRKRDMLHLARLWGYKSNLWRCRAGKRVYTSRAAPSLAPPPFPRHDHAPAPAPAPPLPPGSEALRALPLLKMLLSAGPPTATHSSEALVQAAAQKHSAAAAAAAAEYLRVLMAPGGSGPEPVPDLAAALASLGQAARAV